MSIDWDEEGIHLRLMGLKERLESSSKAPTDDDRDLIIQMCDECIDAEAYRKTLHDQLEKALALAEEQRNRRLDIEDEIATYRKAFVERPAPEIRYVERKVQIPSPRPRRDTVRLASFVRAECTVTKEVPVDRYVHIDVPGHAYPRPAGFFGRLGDRIDRWVA